MLRRTIGSTLARGRYVASVGALLAVCVPSAASAQALLPPAGEGNVAVSFQGGLTRGHVNNFGELVDDESSRAQALIWDVEFGVSDRLAVNVSLPFIAARYRGPFTIFSHSHAGGDGSDIDDGTYHGAFQDFRLAVRFNVLSGPIAITPFVEAIVPSHRYVSRGHSVTGQDLRALVLGAAVGGFADAIPGLYYQSQFSYGVFEEVLNIRTNRTRADSEVGYFVTPRLTLRLISGFQLTHDGLDKIYTRDPNLIPPGFRTPPVAAFRIHSRPGDPLPTGTSQNHDRLLRSNFLALGGGINFRVTESLDIFAAASIMVWKRNVHPLRVMSAGANWHFRMQGAAPPVTSQQAPGTAARRSNAGRTPRSFQ